MSAESKYLLTFSYLAWVLKKMSSQTFKTSLARRKVKPKGNERTVRCNGKQKKKEKIVGNFKNSLCFKKRPLISDLG